MSTVTVTRKAKSLAAIADHFDEQARYWQEQSKHAGQTQKRAAALSEGARVWEQAADFLRSTTIVNEEGT